MKGLRRLENRIALGHVPLMRSLTMKGLRLLKLGAHVHVLASNEILGNEGVETSTPSHPRRWSRSNEIPGNEGVETCMSYVVYVVCML